MKIIYTLASLVMFVIGIWAIIVDKTTVVWIALLSAICFRNSFFTIDADERLEKLKSNYSELELKVHRHVKHLISKRSKSAK